MLELMSPWEYTSGVRPELGHGSGFDSPGWNALRRSIPAAGEAFQALRRAAGLSRARRLPPGREHEELDQLAEALTELDERATSGGSGTSRSSSGSSAARSSARRERPSSCSAGLSTAVLPGALGGPQRADRAGAREASAVGHATLRDEATGLLQELIRLDTVNPPGNETQAAELLRDYLGDNGIESELYARVPERMNLVARIPGRGGPRLLLLSHTDTVLADPGRVVASIPWSGELRDGQVWGRGALDMKDQVAANAVAIASLAREGFEPAGDLVFAATADEEFGETPTSGSSGSAESIPDAVRADYASTRAAATGSRSAAASSTSARGREDELSVRPARARPQRPRVDALDRRQRAREGGGSDRAAGRVQAGAATRPGDRRVPRGACRRRARGRRGARARARGSIRSRPS